eukprot:evm.model.scf_1908.2 EVM.evm.TU.scf_1908.2   scf_1908:17718-21544(+)
MPPSLPSSHLTGVVPPRDPADPGSIELIIGPMFSGKTTELMCRVRRHRAAGRLCLVVKSCKDTRYECERCVLSSHDRAELPATAVERLAELTNVEFMYRVIAVDEGQFFPDLAKAVEAWANAGKIVIVSALDGDFRRHAFKNVVALVPLAEDVVKKTAVCGSCRGSASFTHRLTAETSVEVIGGAETYIPLCRSCYNDKTAAAAKAEAKCQEVVVSRRHRHHRRTSLSSSSTDFAFGDRDSSFASKISHLSIVAPRSEVDFSMAGLALEGSPTASITSSISIR